MSSKFQYLIFHPEYLVDLLRAGGRFPIEQSFSIPLSDSTANEISDFVDKKFPFLSEERHEIWLKFRLPVDPSVSWFSLEDIISSHFYSKHRQEAAPNGVLHTLSVYKIPVLEPIDTHISHIIEEYDSKIREHAASLIIRTWFPEAKISKEFINQLRIGYKYQQSPAPDKLSPIPSELIWAHMVAYNPGLRKFGERPDILWLQDIQEVVRRTDAGLKQQIKLLGEKYNAKYSDVLDDAEKTKKSGASQSKWIIEKRNKVNTYFSELDRYLSNLGYQQSFFYSALFYLNWRDSILNCDYSGRLSDHKDVKYFLNNTADNPMRQAVAEALFTIVYAGGPRVFQQALIEARMKVLALSDSAKLTFPKTQKLQPHPSRNEGTRLYNDLKNMIGRIFSKAYDQFSDTKKKEKQKEIKKIGSTITKIKKGEFSYDQYIKLCLLFAIPAEPFDDYPSNDLAARAIDLDQDQTQYGSEGDQKYSLEMTDSPSNDSDKIADILNQEADTPQDSGNPKAPDEMTKDRSIESRDIADDLNQVDAQLGSPSDPKASVEMTDPPSNELYEITDDPDLAQANKQHGSTSGPKAPTETTVDPSNESDEINGDLYQADTQKGPANDRDRPDEMTDPSSASDEITNDLDQAGTQNGSANDPKQPDEMTNPSRESDEITNDFKQADTKHRSASDLKKPAEMSGDFSNESNDDIADDLNQAHTRRGSAINTKVPAEMTQDDPSRESDEIIHDLNQGDEKDDAAGDLEKNSPEINKNDNELLDPGPSTKMHPENKSEKSSSSDIQGTLPF